MCPQKILFLSLHSASPKALTLFEGKANITVQAIISNFFFVFKPVIVMRNIIVGDTLIKGYHKFQIRPPQCVLLQVMKEYGNKHDPNACLIWVPKLDKISTNLC